LAEKCSSIGYSAGIFKGVLECPQEKLAQPNVPVKIILQCICPQGHDGLPDQFPRSGKKQNLSVLIRTIGLFLA
jgi:hypothetical protein